MEKEYNKYLWSPKQPRVYGISPLTISGTPMPEEDVAASLKVENSQQRFQQNPVVKRSEQWEAQQKQREEEIATSKKWLELHPEDESDSPYTILERGKHQAIVDGKDPSYYEKMINDGKQFTKGALGVLSLPYLGAATAGAYGYGASLGARGLFAAQGIHGLANENGVRKTANLIKSGDYGRAALSGAGDALNAAMILPGAKLLGNAAKYGLKPAVVGDMLGQNVRNAALATSEPLLNVGWGPRQTLKVSRAGEYDQIYFPERWDVVNEGANPHGVWLQGKYGTPRTDVTNPGKGMKAARARNVFSTRPDKYTGTATLGKPTVTVGEVPNRSLLSYQADNMGADGLIYNGVYDNGYNNNQVILSFRRPKLTKTQLSVAEWLGIPKGDRGNLSQEQLDALEDLRYLMDTEKVPNPKIKEFITTGVPYDETLGFRIKTPEGYFRYKPVGNRIQFSYEADNFPTDWGEANMKMYSNAREGKIILTSPYADMFSPRNPIPEGVDPTKYSKTIPKNVMRAFWKNLDENIPKGTYVSGDQGSSPLGQHLYEIWKNRNTIVPSQLDNSGNIILKRRGSSLNDFFNTLYNGTKWNARKDGLSTDSYMAILKQGNRPGHKLRFSRDGFTNFNNQGVENKYIYDLHQRMLNGEISQQDFVNKFNDWVKPYNGMPAKIIDGEVVIPHPFILYKQGGILKRVESGKSGIHIKPENRGKFTALKKRTGKSSTWYKEHGTPAQKKMAIFALNARKWKHK